MENVAEAADRGEDVVEVVGDPAGEPAHRVEALGLAELLLAVVQRGAGAGPVADVGRQHQAGTPPVHLQLVRDDLHVDHGAVLPLVTGEGRCLAACGLVAAIGERGGVLRRDGRP